MRGRKSNAKSAYTTNELPTRQFIADSKPTPSIKSCAKANGTNPAAIFSDAASRPTPYRTTSAESKTGSRNGTSGTSSATRQRSPWRSANFKPVCRSDTEVGRAAARKRCPSVSPEVQRRPVDRTRVASTSRVRRTRSVPRTSTTLAGRCNDTDELQQTPQTSPVTESSSRDRGRLPCKTQPAAGKTQPAAGKTQPTATSPSILPHPTVPVHSTKHANLDNKSTARDVLAEAVKSAWEKVSKFGGPSARGEFLPVLAALLFIVVAVIGRCVYTYMSTTPDPACSPQQPPQPEPLSHESDSFFGW